MGLALCILAFASTTLLVRRSLGHALGLLLAIGCVYGFVRANVYDGFSHFLFDAAVLGFYLGSWGHLLDDPSPSSRRMRAWVLVLALLPFGLILFSPFIDSQPIVIQLLGLRPAMFFVPLILAGSRMERADLLKLATWAAGVALGTALVALGEYGWGIEPFLPVNQATELIYRSKDVGEEMVHRIPSTFVSAHSYGGTMVSILPLLALNLERGGRWTFFGALTILAAVLGVFACAARTPVVGMVWVGLVLAVTGVSSRRFRLAAVAVALAAMVIVSTQSRLQRFETLSDTAYVTTRVHGSVNVAFMDTLLENPLGRGLGSAVGTSIPYFLEGIARPQYGMENEYARLCIEEGLPGVLLWVAFALWTLLYDPRRYQRFGGTFDAGAWAVCVLLWAQGSIGTGLLAAVPGTMILLLYMGALGAQRRAPLAGVALAGAWMNPGLRTTRPDA